ncbi:heat shock protein HSS1, partial [Rhizopogon vinicolor AM-OR11-026]
VGVWKRDHVEIITNEHGNRATPCYVSMVDNKCVVGEQAKQQVPSYPQNTIFNAKRFIGRKFNDLEVQSVMKYYPFDLFSMDGRPHVTIEHQGQPNFVSSAEEILSMILKKMKSLGEAHLGVPCKDAVITVPCYFTDAQRRATQKAAKLAGLKVLRLLNDSTAAVIANGLANDRDLEADERRVLVVCLGAGALDVAFVQAQWGVFEVATVAGDCHLGGEDFDDRLVFHFVQEFWSQHRKDISSDPRALWRLRAECERAKCALSSATRADIALEYLHDGIDFYSSITRAQFEAICSDLFQRILDRVEKVLRNNDPVTEVILVGGSTRIPHIQTMISKLVDGKLAVKSLNPETVATGAAVMAAVLSGAYSPRLDDILALNVASFSLGIQTVGGVMTHFISSSTTIPTKKSETFTTYADNQSSLIFRVFEGDNKRANDNNLLGIFELSDIPPAPRGVPRIEVIFDIDANNILLVTAFDQNTGRMKGVTVSGPAQNHAMGDSYQQFMDEDAGTRVKKTLDWYTSNLRLLITEDKLPGTVKASEKASLESAVKRAEEFLSMAEKESPNAERYEEMQRMLETTSSSILRKHGTVPS